jgi:hypothetical protein
MSPLPLLTRTGTTDRAHHTGGPGDHGQRGQVADEAETLHYCS